MDPASNGEEEDDDDAEDSCSHQERNKLAANRYSGKTRETPIHNIDMLDDSSSGQSQNTMTSNAKVAAQKVAKSKVPVSSKGSKSKPDSSKGSKRKPAPPGIKVNICADVFDLLNYPSLSLCFTLLS